MLRFVCVLILITTGCFSPGRLAPQATVFPGPDLVEVPLRMNRNQPMVSASINGELTRLFLVDTGAQLTVVPRSIAEELGIPIRKYLGFSGGVTRRTWGSMSIGHIESIEIGGVVFEGVDVAILDDSAYLNGPILGFGLFDETVFCLDFESSHLTMAHHESPAAAGLRCGHEIRYDLRHHCPEIEMDVAGRSIDVLLDSGFNGGLFLPTRTVNRLPMAAAPREIGLLETINDRGVLTVARLKANLGFAGHVVEQPMVAVGSGSALIGVELLQEFRLIFEPQRRRVYLDRDASGPIDVPSIRGYGFLSGRDAMGVYVSSVVDDGPANRAGLKVGDRIIGRHRTRRQLTLVLDRDGLEETIILEPGVLVK